jgi:hypothetical protein
MKCNLLDVEIRAAGSALCGMQLKYRAPLTAGWPRRRERLKTVI